MEEKKSSVDGQEAANVVMVMVMSLFDLMPESGRLASGIISSLFMSVIGRGQNPNEKEKLVLASRKKAVSSLN